eukprot:1576442-Amphidinium_carterae.1
MVNFGTLTVQELERGQLIAAQMSEVLAVWHVSEVGADLDGDANGNLNFAAGAFRKQRMRE